MNLTNRILPDLNLVRVFLAIWETRSLTTAGERLSLTQPAVSHALRRLRESFEDPLFVRATGGMVPTELAARLHGPLSEAVQIIHLAVQGSARFDPSTARRVFRVGMSDISEFYFLPMLMSWLAKAAPSVHLKSVPLNPATVGQAMRAGEVDLVIGFVPELDDDVISHCLFRDSFICLVRAGHPITRLPPGQVDLGALGYVYGSTTAVAHHFAERWLTESGIQRRIVLRLGHFTAAPSVVRDTDLAVIFPESVARLINGDGAFALIPLPPGQPSVEIRLHMHPHFRSDAGVRWLRESIIELFSAGHPGAARRP